MSFDRQRAGAVPSDVCGHALARSSEFEVGTSRASNGERREAIGQWAWQQVQTTVTSARRAHHTPNTTTGPAVGMPEGDGAAWDKSGEVVR